MLDAERAEKNQLRELRELRRNRGMDSLLRVQDQGEAIVSNDGPGLSYRGGHVVGIAYLYSFAQKRIACAGRIEATNSPKLDIRFRHMKDNFLDQQNKQMASASATLKRDMEVQIRRAIVSSLHAVSSSNR